MTSQVPASPSPFRRILATAGASLVAIFATGVATGALVATIEKGATSGRLAFLGGALLVAAMFAYVAWKLYRAQADGPASPREKRSRNLFWACGALGGVLGLMLAIGEPETAAMFGDAPLSPAVAAAMLVAWLVGLPLLTWHWMRTVDEHEAEAYTFGGMAALYAYAFLTPAWWVAWRAGFVPEPQHMAIFLLTMAVWGAGHLWRRYR